MINLNGELQVSEFQLSVLNRSFLYGDGVFETLKIVNNKILFFEDHYFRLMASMRIVRMEIPARFTMEYIESQILTLTKTLKIENSARVRFTVFRNEGGFYAPIVNSVSFVIHAQAIEHLNYTIPNSNFEVDLYKDFVVEKQLLSTLKTTNKIIQVTASIFAKENDLDSCLLLNSEKSVIEATNGNLFMLSGNKLTTPPISEGCLNGIMRKQLLLLVKSIDDLEIVEEPISPFELQKADELFITNVITGIQPITKYRKKVYESQFAERILKKLNTMLFN
jgi:branched-chain amino acid aminotransferase